MIDKPFRRIYSIRYHLIGGILPDSYYYVRVGSKSIHITIGLKVRRF